MDRLSSKRSNSNNNIISIWMQIGAVKAEATAFELVAGEWLGRKLTIVILWERVQGRAKKEKEEEERRGARSWVSSGAVA
jgi:hypothetical protein